MRRIVNMCGPDKTNDRIREIKETLHENVMRIVVSTGAGYTKTIIGDPDGPARLAGFIRVNQPISGVIRDISVKNIIDIEYINLTQVDVHYTNNDNVALLKTYWFTHTVGTEIKLHAANYPTSEECKIYGFLGLRTEYVDSHSEILHGNF